MQTPQAPESQQPNAEGEPVPARSLLCMHYAAPKSEAGVVCFDCAVQTLRSRVFNRTKNLLAAMSGIPLTHGSKVSTSTQTRATRQEFQQTDREEGTQPVPPGCPGTVGGGYTMTGRASRYETSEVFLERRLRAVILIQSAIRRYNACLLVAEVRERKAKEEAERQAQAAEKAQKEEEDRQAELQRRLQPRTAADFQLLEDEVATWARQQQFSID